MVNKLKDILGDSRVWVYVFMLAATVLGAPELSDNAEHLGKDVAEAFVMLIQAVGILVSSVTFLLSVERRPLSAKESVNKLQVFEKLLKDAGVKFD